MELDPEQLAVADRYKVMIGSIVPRPIAFVSTISPRGVTNLAPFSFFCGVGSNPMTLAFCPANKPDGTDKDTLRNALPTLEGGMGEFVVNVATESILDQVALAAEPLGYEESEFELTGLSPSPSRRVAPPRVAQSPIAFECRTVQIIRTNPGIPAGGNLVLGEVLLIHVDDELINARFHIDPALLAAVGRMGGLSYCSTRERFDRPMGRGDR